jgi:3-dehydroquinate synthase
MKTLHVALDSRSYPIWISSGLIDNSECWREALSPGRVVIVTNETVGPLYTAAVRDTVESLGHPVICIGPFKSDF